MQKTLKTKKERREKEGLWGILSYVGDASR